MAGPDIQYQTPDTPELQAFDRFVQRLLPVAHRYYYLRFDYQLVTQPSDAVLRTMLSEEGLTSDVTLHPITPETAQNIVQQLLHRSMAYDTELVPMAEACELALLLAEAVGPGVRWHTNHAVHAPITRLMQAHGWYPVTKYTFDGLVAAVGERAVAFLVIGDED